MKDFFSDKNTIFSLVIVFVLIAVLLYTFISGGTHKNDQLYYQCLEKADSIQSGIDQYCNNALALASVFAQSEEVRTAYSYEDKAGGADYLQDYIQPLLRQTSTALETGIIKVNFYKPPAASFLRTWTDIKQDDSSSVKDTVKKVHQTHKPLKCVEVGSDGFAFSGISPIFDGSDYIGSVEVFFEPDDLITKLELNEYEVIYFTINEDIVDDLFWDETKQEYGYNKKDDYYFFSASDEYYSEFYDESFTDYYLDTTVIEEALLEKYTIVENTDYYMTAYIPIYDFSYESIGCVVYMLDKSINTQQGIGAYIAIIAAVLLVILMFIRMQREIRMKNLLQQAQNETIQNLNIATQQLAVLSNHDSLTNLFNRRGISSIIHQKAAEFYRYGTYFSIILCDVDKFKQINDIYGHECGDAALVWLSNVIRTGTRQNDAVSRWGGDEILIVLTSTGYNEAISAAGKISSLITSNEFRYSDQSINLSMTFGVASIDADTTPSQLISNADRALYHGKHTGRNCVTGYYDIGK